MPLLTSLLGYPRIGAHRQLKFALENYWSGTGSSEELLALAAQLRSDHWKAQRRAGIDISPCNDFSFYDTVLDTAVMVGSRAAEISSSAGTRCLLCYGTRSDPTSALGSSYEEVVRHQLSLHRS